MAIVSVHLIIRVNAILGGQDPIVQLTAVVIIIPPATNDPENVTIVKIGPLDSFVNIASKL